MLTAMQMLGVVAATHIGARFGSWDGNPGNAIVMQERQASIILPTGWDTPVIRRKRNRRNARPSSMAHELL